MRSRLMLAVLIASVHGEPVGISSKLDFDEPNLVGFSARPKPPVMEVRRQEIKSGAGFDGIGVVCTSAGCNSSRRAGQDDDGVVKADVVVHVRTDVDLKPDKGAAVDATPDVPVVVGMAGAARSFTSQPPPAATDVGSAYQSFVPLASSTLNPDASSDFLLYGTFALPPQILADNAYIGGSGVEPTVGIRIKTLPSFAVRMDGRGVDDAGYRSNGIEFHLPHFEPSYNNHYFGEHPPPRVLWYPKGTAAGGSLNPVEFKNRPTTTAWVPKLRPPQAHHNPADNTCSCRNHQNPGLQWYPVRPPPPGTQINDKLAPLN